MGNFEVEVKAKISDKEDIKNKLISLGAIFKNKKYQHDILLDHPNLDFSKTDQVLRIRNQDNKWQLDYKGPFTINENGIKSREEYSVNIEDGKQIKNIFTLLNFKLVGEVEKTRESYIFNEMNIDLDEVTNLGSFIEIEILSTEENSEDSKIKIFEFLYKLGIKETVKKDYLELLWEKGYFK
ncbi:MAG TPA: class IV adenylate cyclase [Candidatus Nanoarchaeia archaeon]|nr:class IV adenylate cyclase [Candidatus Nanoarchaeia archaeon]